MVIKFELLVVEGSPFNAIIRDPGKEEMQDDIEIEKRTVSRNRGEHTVAFPLDPSYYSEKEYGNGTDRKEFTYDYSEVPSYSSEDHPEESFEEEAKLVVMIKEDCTTTLPRERLRHSLERKRQQAV